jgi:hypothetical protein
MRTVLLAGAAVLLLLPAASAQQAAVAQPPIAGVWKFNPEKSGTRIPPGAAEFRQYAMRPDGFLVGILVTFQPDGSFRTLQFTAKRDGKDYAEYSDQNLADTIAAGTPTARTYSETAIDADTTQWIDKVNGKITAQGRKIVSADRKTLTITVDGHPQARIYDRIR